MRGLSGARTAFSLGLAIFCFWYSGNYGSRVLNYFCCFLELLYSTQGFFTREASRRMDEGVAGQQDRNSTQARNEPVPPSSNQQAQAPVYQVVPKPHTTPHHASYNDNKNTTADAALGENDVLRRRAQELRHFMNHQISEALRNKPHSSHVDSMILMGGLWGGLRGEITRFLCVAVEQEERLDRKLKEQDLELLGVKEKRWTLKRFALERQQLEGKIKKLAAERDQLRNQLVQSRKMQDNKKEELKKVIEDERTKLIELSDEMVQDCKAAYKKIEQLQMAIEDERRIQQSNWEASRDGISLPVLKEENRKLACELNQEKERYAVLLSAHEKCVGTCGSNLGTPGAPLKFENLNEREVEQCLPEDITHLENREELVKDGHCEASEADDEDDMSSWVDVMDDCV